MALSTAEPRPPRLFISYAHKDDQFREELETHLKPLMRMSIVQVWSERHIDAGEEWEKSISEKLETEDIVLLLISPHFRASQFCINTELKRAMERHEAGEVCVIPVFLRPCDWKEEVFGKLQGIPDDAKPITRWEDRDEAFTLVTRTIRNAAVAVVERRKAHERAKQEAEAKHRREEQARQEAEANAKHQSEECAQQEAKARQELEKRLIEATKARDEAQERAQRAEEQARQEAEARQELEKRLAEEIKARQKAEQRARQAEGRVEWAGAHAQQETQAQGAAEGHPPPWVSGIGQDGYGSWAEITVPSITGDPVTQRLRWIPPGQFLMGSPETEPERSRDEGPQHPVALSRGFWLFDTACTQALWEAVMGTNPSRFKSPDRPVEQVSWGDVQGFLTRINRLVPDLDLELPTEAQWEYACRAGTTTPFSFGATITPEQVNYDGNYPYPGGKRGQWQQETVSVASLPPNPWGLYEMHGNVWEWCRDGKRDYRAQPETDPQGPLQAGANRALRGGSWGLKARDVRSAYRLANDPGNRYDSIGFRCARVQEGREPGRMPEAEQPRSGKPPEAAA